MDNVFDIVEDFYNQDPEWNTVLRQEYAESFLRSQSWKGADNQELEQKWNYIMMLCLYLGNTEGFLGDMTRDDFVDCTAWCGRNIAEFKISGKLVDDFLTTMEDLYAFLAGKKAITSADAPAKARELLLADGQLNIMDSSGSFLPGYERYNDYATPDLPTKIFMNINQLMTDLYDVTREYFNAKRFRLDRERAAFLFDGVMMNNAVQEKPGTDEYEQCFWDYFMFDYYMLGADESPITYFYKQAKNGLAGDDGKINMDLLEELAKARLVMFTVEGIGEEGLFICRDFFTGKIYNFMLPIDENANTDGFVFLGHIFYNETMVMNFVRGTTMPNASRKKLYEVMCKARDWAAIRTGGEMSWEEFVRRFPIFVRHTSLIYSVYIRLDVFNYETAVKDYTPAPITSQPVCSAIKYMMTPYAFSAYDMHLAQTMWMDFQKVQPRRIRIPDIWAAGIIKNFIDVNGVYNYDLQRISEICHNIPIGAITTAADKIKAALKLEQHDPRYINEEGLLLMLLS